MYVGRYVCMYIMFLRGRVYHHITLFWGRAQMCVLVFWRFLLNIDLCGSLCLTCNLGSIFDR